MGLRTEGLIAVLALVSTAVLLGITMLGCRGPEAGISPTATTEDDVFVTPSPSPVATPTPKQPLTYTVQAGDTLSAIAQEHDISVEALTAANNLVDPDVLQIGQVLIIPEEDEGQESAPEAPGETADPSLSPEESNLPAPPTLTPSGPPLVEISQAVGIGDVGAEAIVLRNEGGTVSLESWTLSGPADDEFVFPALTLFPAGELQVHSGVGEDSPRDLYWGRTEPVWQVGELVTLRDRDGNVVDTYILPR